MFFSVALLACAAVVAASDSFLMLYEHDEDGQMTWMFFGNTFDLVPTAGSYSSRSAARSALAKLRADAVDPNNFSIVEESGNFVVKLGSFARTSNAIPTKAKADAALAEMVAAMKAGPEYVDDDPSELLGGFDVLANHNGAGYTWRLRAANGFVVMHGEIFDSVSEVLAVIAEIKNANVVYENFEIVSHPGDALGEFAFNLRAGKSKSAKSWAISEKYKSAGARENGIYSVMHNIASPINDYSQSKKRDLVKSVARVGVAWGEFWVQWFTAWGGLERTETGFGDKKAAIDTASKPVEGLDGTYAVDDLTVNSGRVSRFEIFCSASDTQRYAFRLVADNGEIVLQSELYTTKQNAKKGAASVATNAADEANFEKRTAKDDSPYFVLIAQNSQIIGVSETYSSKGARDHGITAVMRAAGSAETVDYANGCIGQKIPEGFEFDSSVAKREDFDSSASVLAATSAVMMTIAALF